MKGRINKVVIVPGSELKPKQWSRPMQVVYSTAGIYIDNRPNTKGNGSISWVAPDWSKKLGSIVEFDVVDNSGFRWIKPIEG